MRILLVLISCCWLGVSCTSGRKTVSTENWSLPTERTPVFSEGMTEAVFRGGIELYDHYFSGIFALKKEPEGKCRMVLMSEVGMTLIDISFTSKDFKVNYCIEPLRRKGLLKFLYYDFLLLTDVPGPEGLILKKRKEELVLYKNKNCRDFYYFEEGKMVKIVSKAFLNRTRIQLSEMKMGSADSIQIQHRPVKFGMMLKRIK
jgi:hypothetical protein